MSPTLVILLIGIGATVLFDLWGLLVAWVQGKPANNWKLPGRWFIELRRGHVWHKDISEAPEYPNEQTMGWLGHYFVGVVYAIVLLMWQGPGWLEAPTLAPALILGIVTIAFGWFFMQPGMGLGIASSKLPAPWVARGLGLVAHAVFGFGLWASAMILRALAG